MEATLFILYFLVFTFLVTRVPFFKNSELGVWWLAGLFSLKIAAGVFYGWFYHQAGYVAGADTWRYFEMSKEETEWLFRDPGAFFTDLFTSHYTSASNVFAGENSYWNDLKSNVVIKLMALCNVITLKDYYADMVIFNFFAFFGPVALFRMCREKFHTNKLLLAAAVFCIPSFIFWCSGLHKDGLLFSATVVIAFSFNRLLEKKIILSGYLFLMLFCFIMVFALRNYISLLLLPALLVWWLCKFYPEKRWKWIALVYGGGLIFFFTAPYISSSLDFPQYIIDKQKEFIELGGNSQLGYPALQPGIIGFLSYLPYALDTTLLRPHFTETGNLAYLPAIAENFIFTGFIIFLSVKLGITKNKSGNKKIVSSSFVIFCFCFAISSLLLTGYTVTLTGAVVRYRALFLPFIFAPLCSAIKINQKQKN